MSSGSTGLTSSSTHLETIEVTTDKLAKAVEMLANNHQVAIKDLSIDNDRKLYKAYLLVKAVVEALVQTDKYQLIPTLVQQQYRPTMIYPGTAGAFLFGCFQGCYGDSHKYCSPLCISNINDTNKPIQCKYQVWVNISRNNDDVDNDDEDRQNYAQMGNDVETDEAFIYVDDHFKYFSEADIKAFKDKGVNYAQVLKTHNSKHFTLVRMTAVDKLPTKHFKQLKDLPMLSLTTDLYRLNRGITVKGGDGSGGDNKGKLNAIVFILIIIIILFILMKGKGAV